MHKFYISSSAISSMIFRRSSSGRPNTSSSIMEEEAKIPFACTSFNALTRAAEGAKRYSQE